MEIESILQNKNSMSEFERNNKKTKIESGLQEDSVSISAEALVMAKKMFTRNFIGSYSNSYDAPQVTTENQKYDGALSLSYKSYFDQYRGKGFFKESDASNKSASTEFDRGDNIEDGDEFNKTASKLERQLKDLISKLEEVLSSNLPEAEKEAQSNELQKRISELQSQMAGFKQAMKDEQNFSGSQKQ